MVKAAACYAVGISRVSSNLTLVEGNLKKLLGRVRSRLNSKKNGLNSKPVLAVKGCRRLLTVPVSPGHELAASKQGVSRAAGVFCDLDFLASCFEAIDIFGG